MAIWTLCDPSLLSEFGSMMQAMSLRGEEINANWMSRLTRFEHGDEVYYIKSYASRGRGLRRWLGRSRLRAEWENLQFFSRLGIATAQVVAYGETGPWRYRGVIVTQGLPRTRDLAGLVEEEHVALDNNKWRLDVIRRLSSAVCTLHAAGFVHNDLKWRNVLVEPETGMGESSPGVYLIDCPMGRKLRGPLLKRGMIKDLACLDKVAKYALTRTDRLRFYLGYVGRNRLQDRDKRVIGKVVRFFEGRE